MVRLDRPRRPAPARQCALVLEESHSDPVLPARRPSVTTQRTSGSGRPAPGRVSLNVSPNAGDAPSPGSRVVTAEPNIGEDE